MAAKLPIPPKFDSAPSEERIEFVQTLWDRFAQNPKDVPVSDEHKRILDERLDAYAADPRASRAWSAVSGS